MARIKTRRQQIISEQQADLKKIIIIALLMTVILVFAVTSIVSRGAGEESATRRTTVQTEKYASLPEDTHSYPKVVNDEMQLAPSYVPDDLTVLYGVPNGSGIKLRQTAALSFEQMYEAMLEAGETIIPLEGYRSYSEQNDMYETVLNGYLESGLGEGEAIARTLDEVDFPGSSEHQTGLAVDVSADGTRSASFLITSQGEWISEHCWEYGFIIRYPEDKTSKTGVSFKPWHLRYVGREHAEYMRENNMCLEEYAVFVQKSVENAREEN